MKTEYLIVDSFTIRQKCVLVLDEAYQCGGFNRAMIDGKSYPFVPNSVKNWIIIESADSFKGKTIKFVRRVN